MARRRMERSKETRRLENEGNHYWMSFTDLMSALLLVFALLLMANILSNENEMAAKNQKIEEMLGVKTELIKELRTAFSNSDLNMTIDDQTGAIQFSNGVLFKYDSAKISEQGRKSLKSFVPKYFGILLSDEFRDHISKIIIEGHTDRKGTYLYNLNLSQDRSLSVVEEIFSKNFPDLKRKEKLKKILTSNGRSYTAPVYNENGEVNNKKSRRVEFKFRLKNEETIKNVRDLVKGNG